MVYIMNKLREYTFQRVTRPDLPTVEQYFNNNSSTDFLYMLRWFATKGTISAGLDCIHDLPKFYLDEADIEEGDELA